MTIQTYSMYALLTCNAALAAAAAIAILRLQRMVKEQKTFWASPTGAALTVPVAEDAMLLKIHGRLEQLQSDISGLQRMDKEPATGAGPLPLENAVRMARLGASLEDLTRTCGLSSTEARLLLRVHAQPASGASLN